MKCVHPAWGKIQTENERETTKKSARLKNGKSQGTEVELEWHPGVMLTQDDVNKGAINSAVTHRSTNIRTDIGRARSSLALLARSTPSDGDCATHYGARPRCWCNQ